MKLKIYFFGKPNEITDWEQKHIQRIGYRAQIEVVALAQAGLRDSAKNKAKEAESLLKKIDAQDFVIALDEHGKDLTSVQFSQKLKTALVDHGTVVLIVGGAYGLDASILSRANLKLAFGQAVWTRNLVRLMLLEQLYRALEIDGGGNFHKA